MLDVDEPILHERQLEEYYCTLCYALFDFKRRAVTFANSGLPYPIRCSGGKAAQIARCPGVPLGSFAGSTYDEVTLDLQPGDVFVFCSDGIFEAFNEAGEEFGAAAADRGGRAHPPQSGEGDRRRDLRRVQEFRGDAEQTDDQTVVVVKITQ